MLRQEEEAPAAWLLPEASSGRMVVRPARIDGDPHHAEALIHSGEALGAILQAGATVHINGPGGRPRSGPHTRAGCGSS
eukprot:457981-Prorocentrum_lima.AAC.1